MWPAILLLWASLLWTLLCLLFYRDRAIILEASIPAWIVALLLWLIIWSPVSVFKLKRLWGDKQGVRRKRKASASREDTKTVRRNPERSRVQSRKRSSRKPPPK